MIVTLINISEDTYSFLIENAALLKRADVCVCLADTKNGGFNQSIERAKEKLLNYHREGDDNRYPFRCFVNNDGDMAWRLASKEESLRSKTIDYLKASLLFKLCSEGITSFHLKMDDVMKRSLHVCKSFAQVYEKALYTTMTSSLVCMKVFPLYKNGKILLIDGYVVLGDILTEKLSHIRTFFDAANFLGPTVIPNDMDYKDVHMVYDAGVYYDEQLSKYNISNEDNNPLYNLLYKEAFSPQEFHRFGIDDVSSFFSSIEELCQEKRSEGYIDRFMEKKTAVGGLKDIARVRGNFGSYENWLILEAVLRYVLDAWESFPLFRSRFFCLRRLRKLIYRSYTSNSFKEDDFMSKGMLTDFQSEMHFQSNILDSYDLDSVESFFKENVDGYVNSWLLLYDLPLSLKEAVDFVCKQDIEDKETVFHILQGRALEFLKRNSAIDLVKFAKNNKLLMRPAITFNISKEEISFESLEIKFCILSTLERLIFDEYRNSLPAECLRVAFISSIGEINLNNLQRKVASLFVKVGSENREKVEEMKKCVDSWVSTYLTKSQTYVSPSPLEESKLMPQGQKNTNLVKPQVEYYAPGQQQVSSVYDEQDFYYQEEEKKSGDTFFGEWQDYTALHKEFRQKKNLQKTGGIGKIENIEEQRTSPATAQFVQCLIDELKQLKLSNCNNQNGELGLVQIIGRYSSMVGCSISHNNYTRKYTFKFERGYAYMDDQHKSTAGVKPFIGRIIQILDGRY